MTQVAVNETLVNDALRFSAYQTAEEMIEEALKIFISFKTQRGETQGIGVYSIKSA